MVFFVAAVTCISSLNLATREAVARATSSQQAVRVVQNWFAREQAPLETAMPGQVAKVATHRDAEGEPLYYVVELLPQGFVVVSADDLIEPIIAFQASGSFDPSPENPLGALVQTDLQDRMGEITFFSGQSRLSTEGAPWNTAQEKWAMLEKAGRGSRSKWGWLQFLMCGWHPLWQLNGPSPPAAVPISITTIRRTTMSVAVWPRPCRS